MSKSEIEYKAVPFELKAGEKTGQFSGLGAAFGNVDHGGDMIEPGAFKNSLKRIEAKGTKVPVLWQHDWREPLGHWESLKETNSGLHGDGILLTETDPLALRAYGLIKAGSVSGLSIGYRTLDFEYEEIHGKQVRVLKELELHEVSVVTFPMNEDARIDAVKASEMTERDVERLLTRDAGLSRGVAQKLMAGGYAAMIATKRDAGSNKEVSEIIRKNIELLKG